METNLGTEAIAETTMGMQVPAQPRKDKLVLQTTVDVDMNGPPSPDTKLTGNKWSVVQEKDILNSFGETDHHYNLRTEDISGAIQKSSANARSKMHETKEKSPNLKRKEAKKRDEVVDMETK